MTTEKTKVLITFKKDGGGVFALFVAVWRDGGWWDDAHNYGGPWMNTTYAHIGQHSDGESAYCRRFRNATPTEYAPLLRELTELVGYEVVIK